MLVLIRTPPCSLGIVMYTRNPCLLSLSSQGSIQQLTIYADPRTPEELCEAQESSVSLRLPLPLPRHSVPSSPSQPGEGWLPSPSPHSASGSLEASHHGQHCPESYFGLLAFLHPLKLFSRLLGVGAVRLRRCSCGSQWPGFHPSCQEGCQDSKIRV